MSETAPIRIKFVGRAASESVPEVWLRQLPGGNPHYRGCTFLFDLDEPDYDWLIVYDDLPAKEGERFSSRSIELACPRAHTMLITMEPSSIKLYGSAFLKQFGAIISSQEPEVLDHPGHIHSQAGLRWYYGLGRNHMLTYDGMTKHPPLEKTRDISTVCSNKRQRHTLHNLRYDFTQELKGLLPDLDVFGHGVRDMDDKAEALSPYRYHVAVENHLGEHHITEKLPDCFLAWVCQEANVPVKFDLMKEFSRNSLDLAGSLEDARKARLDGCDIIHGVKSQKELDYIMSAP